LLPRSLVSENQRQQADDDEQTDQEYDTDRAANEFQHSSTSRFIERVSLTAPRPD
jgi:hypothetical protein